MLYFDKVPGPFVSAHAIVVVVNVVWREYGILFLSRNVLLTEILVELIEDFNTPRIFDNQHNKHIF